MNLKILIFMHLLILFFFNFLFGQVVMDNGVVSVTLSIPGGMITQISYKGIPNVLDTKESRRG